mmetsp:Transcript_3426/g.10405  ORF Transcript_3426/g.10405 Transcript_3426/m.10405 type:complete len:113 (-) Transcript_3426:2224-2562(-)
MTRAMDSERENFCLLSVDLAYASEAPSGDKNYFGSPQTGNYTKTMTSPIAQTITVQSSTQMWTATHSINKYMYTTLAKIFIHRLYKKLYLSRNLSDEVTFGAQAVRFVARDR